MHDYADFAWTPEPEPAQLAAAPLPWGHYRSTAVEFAGHGTLTPCDAADAGQVSPLAPLHVLSAVQPDGTPDSPDSRARLAVLDRELRSLGLQVIPTVGSALDGSHREDSRAVSGLDDAAARALGARFGQVAVFAWRGPHWSLLACVGDRADQRGWRFTPR